MSRVRLDGRSACRHRMRLSESPLALRHGDVVLLQRGDHVAAQQAHVHRDQAGRERDGGQQHGAEVLAEVAGRLPEDPFEPARFVAGHRDLSEERNVGFPLHPDPVREGEGEHEAREREQREGTGVDRAVGLGADAVGGEHAERDCDDQGDDLRVEHQLQRHRECRAHLVGHRRVRLVVLPEITLREVAEPRGVLLEERLVEAVVRPELRLLRRGAVREHRVGDVTREQPQQREREQRREDDDHDQLQEPSPDRPHGVRSTWSPRDRARVGDRRGARPACRRRRGAADR